MYTEKLKVLVVDDERDIVSLLKDFLTLKGYDVVDAYNSQEALGILREQKTDLVLLDVMMPGMRGTEAAKVIREKYPLTKIVILTGYPEDIGKELMDDKILDGIFTKPVKMHELLDKLLFILNRSDSVNDVSQQDKIKARLLLIKARLLFVESSLEVYNLLETHFRELARKGEHYLIDVASSEQQLKDKVASFEPDIILINASTDKGSIKDAVKDIFSKEMDHKEVLVYNIAKAADFTADKLKNLVKNVETSCFTRGFIEYKNIYI